MGKPTSSAPPTTPLPFQQKPQPRAGSTQPGLAASPNPSQNPRRRSGRMLLGTRKRGHAGGGGGLALLGNHGLGSYARPGPPGHSGGGNGSADGHGDDGLTPALLDALRLGSFARLDLPAPPDGLDLTASVKPSSGCIIVSMGGNSITAWPCDLVAALSLPLGTLDLAAEGAALFSSVEAIAAVRLFVHNRLLLGGTGDCLLPEEIVEALQLVEDGNAYKVDWGCFVWAFLRWDVLIEKGRRCSPYLLRLMKCQKPNLFSVVDRRLHSFSNMENAALYRERTLTRTLAEIQQMKEKVKEKDIQINFMVEDAEKELQARHTGLAKFEHDKMVRVSTLPVYKKMFQESSAAFLEYRKMICEESGVSSLDVVADEKNQVLWMQHKRQAHEIVNGIYEHWLSKVSACDGQFKVLLTKLADINNEVQRLRDSRSIPDLNVGPHI